MKAICTKSKNSQFLKRVLVGAMVALVCLFLTGCGKSSEYEAEEKNFKRLCLEIKDLWNEHVEAGDPCDVYHPFKTKVRKLQSRYFDSVAKLREIAYTNQNKDDIKAFDTEFPDGKKSVTIGSELYSMVDITKSTYHNHKYYCGF